MKIPKGKLIPIGGGEAKKEEDYEERQEIINFKEGVLSEVIAEMNGKEPMIRVIPFASRHQPEMTATYRKAFRKLGHIIDTIVVDGKDEVDDRKNIEKLLQADGVFFTGGDQSRLKEMLDGTHFLEVLKERYYNDKFVIAGTSAGAMIMSEFMIDSGEGKESLLKGLVKITEGSGFLPGTIIDTHFLNRGRIARLVASLLQRKHLTGIGISEDNAVVVTGGNELRAIGSGSVVIIESDDIRNTNFENAVEKEPIYVENLKIHFLAKGASYLLKEKKFIVKGKNART
jgi:cyanophycinase